MLKPQCDDMNIEIGTATSLAKAGLVCNTWIGFQVPSLKY